MGDEVIKVLNHLGKQFGIAIDWSSANVMPYLQDLMGRMVKYGIYQNASNIIYCIILATVFIIITKKLCKTANKYCEISEETDSEEDNTVAMFFTVSFVISFIVTAIVIITSVGTIKRSVDNIIELNTVPEKYVIEMIQDQIDENK